MKRRIVLCADDYGQALAISHGILVLIQQQRLSATSCLVTFSHWEDHASWLLPLKDQIDIGLHFNLTEGMALSSAYQAKYGAEFYSLSKLMLLAGLERLDQHVIAAELRAQISRFQSALGFLPRFLDGHQHVHQFPVIRQAVLTVYAELLRASHTYVRLVNMPFNWRNPGNIKKLVIKCMGGRAMQRQLAQLHIPHNTSFSGVYSFSDAQHYNKIFPQFLASIQDGGMIMCHPGLADTTTNDAIKTARYHELQYFESPEFVADCKAQAVSLQRFNA